MKIVSLEIIKKIFDAIYGLMSAYALLHTSLCPAIFTQFKFISQHSTYSTIMSIFSAIISVELNFHFLLL